MHAAHSLIALCLVTMWTISASADVPHKPPGCFKRDELEASIKRERKIPYDSQAPRLGHCHVTQPVVSEDMRREGKTRVAIFVFDVTGSGRVVERQLIGQKTPWTELSEKEVAKWLFEPLVEGDVGITRVGVTVALVAKFVGKGQGCSSAPSPPVIKGMDFEVRICASR